MAVKSFTYIGCVYSPGWYSVHPAWSGHPSTLYKTDVLGGSITVGTLGLATSAYGSSIGLAPGDHDPLLPPLKFEGAVVGVPKSPKLPPLKFCPALLRSIVPLPLQPPLCVAVEQVWLLELTCMLRLGPPTTPTVALPLTSKAC